PRRFLAALSDPPAGVYRAKGMLALATADGPRPYDVALVGRRLELRARPVGAGGEDTVGLVVIGVDLDDDEVAHFLDEAVRTPGEPVDTAAVLGLHPYLVGDPDSSDVEEWIYDEQRTTPLTGAAAMLADPEDPEAFDPAFTP
ncbi:MAG TPA: GTP-binding protein, partial [Dietzia sp.]|nr:GTP-binding protein [Dietzia sp.]